MFSGMALPPSVQALSAIPLSHLLLLCKLPVLALVWSAPRQHHMYDRSHVVSYSDHGLREHVDHLVPGSLEDR